MIERDPRTPTTSPRFGWWTAKATCAVYHAASEDAIKDAVEDIALLQKKWTRRPTPRKTSGSARRPPSLPVLGPEGHTVPPFAFLDSDSVGFHHDCAGQLR